MTEQFLQRTQVRPPSQQMGGETMPQCMRRGATAKAEPRASAPHRATHQVGRKRATPLSPKQGQIAYCWPGAELNIILNRPRHRCNNRYDSGLAPLSRDADRRPDRQDGARQRDSFSDAQSGAVEQKEDREIARRHPGQLASFSGILRDSESISRSNRAWDPALHPGALDGRNAAASALRKHISKECPHS